ncbi:MAG TPA: tol-pal system protein YbgF [Nitrococcus sp.]|nr:tol-pal system protein YbgF [Nitrococcus sp.]
MKSLTTRPWLTSSALVALLVITGTGTSLAQDQQSIDKRLTLIERKLDNAALGEMANRMEALRQQLQNLQGENDQMQRQIQELKERQRNIYSDIDSRLRALEQNAAGSSSSAKSPPPPSSSMGSGSTAGKETVGSIVPGNAVNSTAPPDKDSLQKQASGGDKAAAQGGNSDSTGEHEAYEQAFNTLKEGRYAKSQQEFNELLQRYPHGQYADNARYWLGESYYAGRQFDQALVQFQKVLDDFPNSAKRPGAQLKIGFIQFERGKLVQARKTLAEVIQRYPNSTAASLAQQRLRIIDNKQQ